MVGIVKEINGQKKIVPLTTDTGTGAPVGTLISQYKKVPMSGYLYCDGSTFDENAYPALYMYLGTNVLPDYRECVMVGAEQNTTDTIATHDVYGEGEFKDDHLQSHKHMVKDTAFGSPLAYGMGDGNAAGVTDRTVTGELSNRAWEASGAGYLDTVSRYDTTTHGKQKAVYVYIKATSGLAENQQENVLNEVKDYIRRSNELSPIETITLTTTYQTAQYDGFLFLRLGGNNSLTTNVYINDETLVTGRVAGQDEDTLVFPICKGDTFRVDHPETIWWSKARWYKNR